MSIARHVFSLIAIMVLFKKRNIQASNNAMAYYNIIAMSYYNIIIIHTWNKRDLNIKQSRKVNVIKKNLHFFV